MVKYDIQIIAQGASTMPARLSSIPQPPQKLYMQTNNWSALQARPCVAVVGSRKVSTYGRAVTQQLVTELARAGVVIVSGLAIGVDAIAHRAALEAGGLTVAVLPSSLDSVYPRCHRQLADQILQRGGALLSEYQVGARPHRGNFIERNRLVSGLAQALLVTEATQKSGTLHTVRFALEQGREVLAVPGNITSPTSVGTNNLIKSGATPVICATDIFHNLGIERQPAKHAPTASDPQQQSILDALAGGLQDGQALLAQSKLDIQQFNQAMTMLEITGAIRALGNNQWALN